MNKCQTCGYAWWDYEEYYGCNIKRCFIDHCQLDNDINADDCNDYEEYVTNENG